MLGYDTVNYAQSRLVDTTIRLKNGIPIHVLDVTGSDNKIIIKYSYLTDEANLHETSIDNCDLNPVSLGYVNHNKKAFYIMRMPMRKDWRQGLRMLNMIDSNGLNPRNVPMKSVVNTIMNKFPKIQTCLDNLNSSKKTIFSMAFHKDFSIYKEGALEYKGIIPVGVIDMNNGSLLIYDQYNWVREALDEAMEKVI